MKYFRMGWDEIMYERSAANISMLLATIPDYSKDKEKNQTISKAEKMANALTNL